jgi:hypothetical protein
MELKYLIAGLIGPFFWLIVLSVCLWLTRKLFPKAESWLFAPLSVTVRRVLRAIRHRGA